MLNKVQRLKHHLVHYILKNETKLKGKLQVVQCSCSK